MKSSRAATLRQVSDETSRSHSSTVAVLSKLPDGRVMVDWGDGPVAARHVARVGRADLVAGAADGRQVLVVFDAGDAARPIIVDFVVDPVAAPRELAAEARVDGRRVVIEAQHEVMLRCGKGYILIRADGQVVIKGSNLLSRSTGVNKIKGGAVRIN